MSIVNYLVRVLNENKPIYGFKSGSVRAIFVPFTNAVNADMLHIGSDVPKSGTLTVTTPLIVK